MDRVVKLDAVELRRNRQQRRVDRRRAGRVRQDVLDLAAYCLGRVRKFVRDHRAVRHVFEHTRNRAVDITNTECRVRHDLALDAQHEFPHVRELRVRVDRIGADALDQKVVRDWCGARRLGHDAVRNRPLQVRVEIVRTARAVVS